MKIQTAHYTMRKGGAYDRFRMLLEALVERQCEIHCVSMSPIQVEHPRYHNHALFFPFKMGDGLVTKFMVVLLFPFYSLLIARREKIDLFVAFGSLYAFILAIPKWILRKPMVTLIRGNSTFGLKMKDSSKSFLWLNKTIEYLGLLSSDRIITVNASIQEEIIKRVGRKKNIQVNVLLNNIPPMPISLQGDMFQARTQFGIPEGAKVLVTAGVISRGKNIETLIQCLSKIGMNNLFLLVAGDGSTKSDFYYQDYLKKLTKTLSLDKRVIFTGWLEREKLWKVFLCADLFVLPSKSEGIPNAMLEALGFDLPCIGSNIPGIRDILKYDELMFDPWDMKSITEGIRQFFCDNRFLEKVSNLCQQRKKVFIFDWKERVFLTVTKGIPSATVN
jgi:glycosyltransferase involved in cell wall biosynthesis